MLIFALNSCGLAELINGYKKYIYTNENGRRELMNKKFKDKFKTEMLNGVGLKNTYRMFYENKSIAYKKYSYLRFFKNGQYAYFVSKNDDIDLNLIDKANHVGYFIIDKGILKLETPTGNFNTRSFRVINKYKIEDNKLIQIKSYGGNLIYQSYDTDKIFLNQNPNW